jgi:hypothetical protein
MPFWMILTKWIWDLSPRRSTNMVLETLLTFDSLQSDNTQLQNSHEQIRQSLKRLPHCIVVTWSKDIRQDLRLQLLRVAGSPSKRWNVFKPREWLHTEHRWWQFHDRFHLAECHRPCAHTLQSCFVCYSSNFLTRKTSQLDHVQAKTSDAQLSFGMRILSPMSNLDFDQFDRGSATIFHHKAIPTIFHQKFDIFNNIIQTN